ncbi:MAG: polysaccharide biosynthesis C-terminal domain-containing protein, partial [Oscillospiraceae bacterium]|nr:polysaccharide biosynthesis C-terminal domain-containing protein [Oscillospiraceae bacterium]
AIGDSRRPLYYLIVCCIINIVRDVVLVVGFGMGVAGVAIATAASQCTSALLVSIQLLKTAGCVKIIPRDLRIHLPLLKQILRVGIPSSIQMSITAFSNVFVQSYINFFGDNLMSAWTTYSKVDAILFLHMKSNDMEVSTFVGQNLGAGQVDRAKRGVKRALVMTVICSAVLMTPVLLFAPTIVRVFNDAPQVVEYGTMLLRFITPFFLVSCANHIYSGALRGAGNSRATMIIMLSTFVGCRQLYLYIMSRICNEVLPIAFSYPFGWILCSLTTVIYYHTTRLDATRLTKK